jgi:hypothetical protein
VTTGSNWEARSFSFVAPDDAASLPFLVFIATNSTAVSAYPGLDQVALTRSFGASPPRRPAPTRPRAG